MDIVDALTSSQVPSAVKHLLIDLMDEEPSLYAYSPILTPRDSNDDLNGSQHVTGGGTDFTYEDASESQLSEDSLTFGTYDYFAREGDHYTGHSYRGEGPRFTAVVVNPPAYAATHSL